MVPMGDNFNHQDVTVVQELVNVQMHLEGDPTSSYFTRSKFMNDFTPLFEEHGYEHHLENKTEKERQAAMKNVKGHFDRPLFNKNRAGTHLETWKHLMETTDADIWDVPFIRDTFDEDNDT
jgi:hypothetical protein